MNSRICLYMIVRDEVRVIRRCLESVAPILDSAVIIDTGSVDRTANLAMHVLREFGVFAAVYHCPWIDFATNRQQALAFAKHTDCDWLFTIDADETLESMGCLPEADGGFVRITQGDDGWTYRQLLARADLPWLWKIPVHEHLTLLGRDPKLRVAQGWKVTHHADGRRHQDPERFAHDARVLESYLVEHPGDRRAQRYLSRSLQDAYRANLYG